MWIGFEEQEEREEERTEEKVINEGKRRCGIWMLVDFAGEPIRLMTVR